jgi:protein gp37
MNKSNIEFCDFTFNPIVGCSIGCKFCYARRFNARYKFIPTWEKPQFFTDRLNERIPGLPKRRDPMAIAISPDRPVIFVGSMCDIFSDGVDHLWQSSIMVYIHRHPEAVFILLSKRPLGFQTFLNIPENCIIGTSIEKSHLFNRVNSLRKIETKGKKIVLVEPIMSYMYGVNFSDIDYIIVGAETGGRNPVIPLKGWVQSIDHNNIFYKDNLKKYFPELS